MPDLTGLIRGRYEIIEAIGKGGMAKIYRAHDKRLGRDAAIKIIELEYSQFGPDERKEYIKRFKREVKILATLQHPNIVSVWDCGEHQGAPYFVMDYYPNGTLRQKMTRPISWREAVRILIPMARGLSYAHKQGIIHRDIKPSNILINDSGEPILSDFGIARLLEPLDSLNTMTGAFIGSNEYMAPEQIRDPKEVDGRADIFSLCVVLYEMITGRRPFKFKLDAPGYGFGVPMPDPRKYIPGLPNNLIDVMTTALSNQPKQRYKNMDEFLQALKILLQESPEKATPAAEDESITRVENAPLRTARGFLIGAIILFAAAALLIASPALLNTPGLEAWLKRNPPMPATTSAPETPLTAPAAATDTELPPTQIPTLRPSPPASFPGEILTPYGNVMRLVPAGEFRMGSNAFGDETPVHNASVEAFYMDEKEVSNAQYRLCVKAGKCQAPLESRSATRPSYYGNAEFDDFPVIYVDWEMARTYCAWRGARLPSEAEWEKAARGTDGRTYPWGEELDCRYANYGQSTGGTCTGDTTEAGSYESGRSPYGLYDMAGNVNEWVNSLYGPYPYRADDGREAPESEDVRGLRGGSWNYYSGDVRAANRNGFSPGVAGNSIGFRCAREP